MSIKNAVVFLKIRFKSCVSFFFFLEPLHYLNISISTKIDGHDKNDEMKNYSYPLDIKRKRKSYNYNKIKLKGIQTHSIGN